MHLLIPFASALSDAAAHVLRDLSLPNLSKLLTRLTPASNDEADEYSLSPPHERALATARGWSGADGLLPFGAHDAAADGIAVGDLAWGLVTPTHWHVARDHVSLADPAALALTDAESRAAFDAVRDLFESEGLRAQWGAATRWYVAHDSLADLPCASLDRVIGRNVELWMRPGANPQGKLFRRLQSEVQLLMYPHPINEAREANGQLTLNSLWLNGCGRFQPSNEPTVQVDDSLRAPLLAEDWAGWAEAWRRLDAQTLPGLVDAAQRGKTVALTLCGERSARRFESTAPSAPSAGFSLWQKLARRWNPVEPHTILETL